MNAVESSDFTAFIAVGLGSDSSSFREVDKYYPQASCAMTNASARSSP